MLTVTLITPERVVYQDTADSVTLPTVEGTITVLPGHIPLMAQLVTGEAIIRKDSQINHLAVAGGFIEVTGAEVKILADSAEHAAEINEQEAVAAYQRAQELLRQTKRSDVETYASLSGQLEKELARVRVARRHRSHHQPHIESK